MKLIRSFSLKTFPTMFLLIACSTTSQQTDTQVNTNILAQSTIERAITAIDSRANELLTQTGLPGMAIAIVHQDKIMYAKGFGVRKIGTDLKVDPNTVFLLASVSKQLSATAIAAVVGNGRVSWDDPVAKYLKGFTLSNPEVGAQVTIADMFAHRSGLPDHAGDLIEDIGYERKEIINRLRFEQLEPFLSTYRYTNFGLEAGAQAVATAEGLSWEDLIEQKLYIPLQMTSSSSRWADYNKSPHKADIHIKNKQGVWEVSARNPEHQSAAGGASSSVNDMAKWMIMVLNDGAYDAKQLIDKQAMLAIRDLPTNVKSVVPSNLTKFYGLGIVVNKDIPDKIHLSHSGIFALGTSTTFDLLLSEKLGIVVLTNGMPLGIAEILTQEFYDIIEHGSVQKDRFPQYSAFFEDLLAERGELIGKQPPTNPTPPLSTNAYIGTYSNALYGPATIKAVGQNLQLVIGPNNMIFPMQHWNGNTFAFETRGENKTGLSAIEFMPQGPQPTMRVEFFNAGGRGIFNKTS